MIIRYPSHSQTSRTIHWLAIISIAFAAIAASGALILQGGLANNLQYWSSSFVIHPAIEHSIQNGANLPQPRPAPVPEPPLEQSHAIGQATPVPPEAFHAPMPLPVPTPSQNSR